MRLTPHRILYLIMASGMLILGLSIVLPTMLSGWIFTIGLLMFALGFIVRWLPWVTWPWD